MECLYGKSAGESTNLLGKELMSGGKHQQRGVAGVLMVQLSMTTSTYQFDEDWTESTYTAVMMHIHRSDKVVPKHWHELTHKLNKDWTVLLGK